MRKIILSKEQIEKIKDNYINGISSEKICLEYNVSPYYICSLLKENNIKIRGNKKEINTNEIIALYKSNNLSMREICDKYGVSSHKILTILKQNGIERKSSKKYEYYDDIFDVIDTEDKSYWLGFLYADGYVRQREKGSELRLKLSIKDKDHLLKFKRFISPDDIPMVYEEYKNSKSIKISVNSKKIVTDLIKKGCVNRKSKIIEFPKFLPENLINHFIRGYFDGDGSISFTNKSIMLNMVSGSFSFLKDISKKLGDTINCKYANLNGSSENYKYINFSSKDDLFKIHNYFYINSNIYLDRKKQKYDFVINNFTELKNEINKERCK